MTEPTPEQVDVSARIVRAAEECFERYGVPKTTLDDIAGTAGLSRSTVYRYFPGGRDSLIVTVVVSDTRAFLDDMGTIWAEQPTLSDVLVTAVMKAVESVRESPVLSQMLGPESVGHTALVTSASTALMDMTVENMRPYFESAQNAGHIRSSLDAVTAAEVLLRTVFSLLSVTGLTDRDAHDTESFLRAALVPVFIPDDARS